MDREALVKQLIGVFLSELTEHVRSLNRDLLALEAGVPEAERPEILRSLLRSAHSLKGAARAVGVAPIEKLCHGLEELFTQAESGRRALDNEIFAMLFAGVDALDDAGKRLREERGFEDAPIGAVTAWISRVVSSPKQSESAPPARLPPSPLPSPLPNLGSLEMVPSRRGAKDIDVGHVRVAARKLDMLLSRTGELSVARAHLDQRHADIEAITELSMRLRVEWQRIERPMGKLVHEQDASLPRRLRRSFERIGELAERLERDLERLGVDMRTSVRACHAIATGIDAQVKKVRMLPFAEACQGLGRMIRDLGLERGKDVELAVLGGDVEMDRSILEGLKDPLMHLARNAIDHGIEPTEVRRAAGKSERGRVEIAARLRGVQIEVTVADDGRGLDVEAVSQCALEKGIAVPDLPQEIARLIFLPGFSTSRALTVVSGRGVGLDVVKSRVESLHGQVDVSFVPGRGVTFSLTVPLTVTTIRAVLVEASGQTFAFPSTSVDRLLRIPEGGLRFVQGRPVLFHCGAMIEIVSLAGLLGLPTRELLRGAEGANVIVVSGRGHVVGFIVDVLVGVEEILVKNLGRRLRRVRYVSGATALPTGHLALILSAGELVAEASRGRVGVHLAAARVQEENTAPTKKRILIVDDSVTTRSLAKGILEAAGFEVIVAVDGQEALGLLENRGAELVVSDVEMPRMDGLALTESIRASRKFARLPVILMTGLGSERDKERGLEVGADAYLVKSAFDKDQLLDTIAQLL